MACHRAVTKFVQNFVAAPNVAIRAITTRVEVTLVVAMAA